MLRRKMKNKHQMIYDIFDLIKLNKSGEVEVLWNDEKTIKQIYERLKQIKNQFPFTEGKIRKGGLKPKPSSPRPKIKPLPSRNQYPHLYRENTIALLKLYAERNELLQREMERLQKSMNIGYGKE